MTDDDTADEPDDESDGYGDLEVADTASVTFNAPPELVQNDEGRYGAMYPRTDLQSVTYWWGDQWECENCGTLVTHRQDRGAGELETPDRCPGCDSQPAFRPKVDSSNPHVDHEDLRDLIPDKHVYEPPVADFDFAADPTFADVYDEIRDYLFKYWAAGEGRSWLYDMLTCYAISTWFRECWNFVPHLLIQGSHETGKSRLLNTLKNVSYRCVHNADLTSAYIYRGINSHNLTMYISEYHRLNEEEQQSVDSVINAGQKRGETIGRASEQASGGYGIESFDPFSHVAVSTQYEPDDDLISRCFRITTKPAQRSIPRQLDDRPDLRKQLLYLRFRYLRSGEIEAAENAAVESMNEMGVRNRLSEKLWCILTVGELADKDLSHVAEAAIEREEERQRYTEESVFVQALIDEAFERLADYDDEQIDDSWSEITLPISDIRDRFARLADRDISASYIGQLRSRVNLGKVRHSDGTKIKDGDLKGKLKQLAEETNVSWEPSPGIVEDTHTIEISTEEQPKHSLEEENEKPSQKDRKQTLLTVCEMIDTNDEPTTVSKAAEVAASQSEADEDAFANELEILLSEDRRFERTEKDGEEAFNYLS